MKPVGLSRGRGISLLNDMSQVNYSEPMVVQRYIMNPMLLDGYKFDLRLCVPQPQITKPNTLISVLLQICAGDVVWAY
jgi:hypothetical protein